MHSRDPLQPSAPSIRAVARALPPHYASQEQLIAAFRELWATRHFNLERLEDLHRAVRVNGRHLALPLEEYAPLVGFQQRNDAWIRVATELGEQVVPYFVAPTAYDEAASAKYLQATPTPELLAELGGIWQRAEPWGKERLEELLRQLATDRGVKAAALIHPTRMALSASTAGPPLFDLVEVLGREVVGERLGRYVEHLERLREAPTG